MSKKVSFNLMVYNEERCIKRCIDSIYDIADEIVIVDTGSEDNTLKILGLYDSFKVKVFKKKWKNNFSEIRNYMISKSTGDIIVQIDADEYLDNTNSDVKKILLEEVLENKVYAPRIIDNYGNENSGFISRIFLNNNKFIYYGLIHEEIRSVYKNDFEKIKLNIRFIHDGYEDEIVKYKNKGKRNLKLSKKMMEIESLNPKWHFYYIRDMFNYTQNRKKIFIEIQKWKRKLNYKKNKEWSFFNEYIVIIECYLVIELKLKNKINFKKMYKKYPGNIDVYFLELLFFQVKINEIFHKINGISEKFLVEKEEYKSYFNKFGNHIDYLLSNFMMMNYNKKMFFHFNRLNESYKALIKKHNKEKYLFLKKIFEGDYDDK